MWFVITGIACVIIATAIAGAGGSNPLALVFALAGAALLVAKLPSRRR